MASKSAVRSLRTALSSQVTSPLPSYSSAASFLGKTSASFSQSQTSATGHRRKTCGAYPFSTSSRGAILPSVDDRYKTRTVHDLLSLKDKVTVVTGGGRGIGLALARGCVEAGGGVAILDALPTPHADYAEMKKEYPDVKVEFYQYVGRSGPIRKPRTTRPAMKAASDPQSHAERTLQTSRS
jgi:hypothetical protein